MTTWVDLIDPLADTYASDVAAGLYTDESLVTPPTGDLGWGSDLQGWLDLTDDVRERRGDDPLVAIEALLRRINTERGQLPTEDDPDNGDFGDPDVAEYGYDVVAVLNRGFSPEQLANQARLIQSEITKDDRFTSIRVTLTRTTVGNVERIEVGITGELVTPDINRPFGLTLSVTSAEVLLTALSVPS